VVSFDGSTIDANIWLPYQPLYASSPGFPDFPSGHAGFVQAFADVMTRWFGTDIPPSPPQACDDMYLATKIFSGNSTQTVSFGTVVFNTGISLVQPGTVPASQVVRVWKTWQEMADDASFSRLLGGVHGQAAVDYSRSLARSLAPSVRQVWGFTPSSSVIPPFMTLLPVGQPSPPPSPGWTTW
jgi:hypothetical protein